MTGKPPQTITVGGASGYWGDAALATPQLLAVEGLDYLVYDYLAEVTMSIMARARTADPDQGYATDFVAAAMAPHLQRIAERGVRVIANAGGVNPRACAAALRTLIAAQGLDLVVATVLGDDLTPRVQEFADVWNDGNGNSVRSPVVARPVEIDAPDEVSGKGVSGSLAFDVSFGYGGDYSLEPLGLQPAREIPGSVVDDPDGDINTALGTGVGITFHLVNVPEGAALHRFALFDDHTDGNDDLDMYVFNADGSFVAGSGSGTSAEQVDVVNPDALQYIVIVHGWETDGVDANYTLFSWSVGGDEGNLTVTAPATAVSGETGSVTVDWKDLLQEVKYLGVLSHQKGDDEIARTLISVDTD